MLINDYFTASFFQRSFDHIFRAGELVYHHFRARRLLFQKRFDASPVRPGKQTIYIFDLGIKSVICGGAYLHDGISLRAKQLTYLCTDGKHRLIGHLLAILDTRLTERLGDFFIHIAACRNQRTEVIALA